MRSIDIDLRKALEFRPERGELRLFDERMLLLNRGALRALYLQLQRSLGPEMTRAFLMQLGQRWGEHDYETLNRAHDWDTEHDRLFAGPVSHMWEGVVHVEATTVDYDRAAGRFLVRGIWRNSYEVDLHRELAAAQGTPGDWCMCLAGHATGWASAFFGRPLLAIETGCVSHGAPHCTFEIRPDGEFGPEATLWRQALVGVVAPASPPPADASVALGSFAATMSHELRTPAAAVIGLCESLAGTALTPAQKRTVTLLRESAESLVGVVHDVLELAQLDAGELTLEPAPLDLRVAVEQAAATIEPRARDKGLTFFVTTQDGCETRLVADAGRIRQVVACLCTTAVKLTETGAVVVTLKASQAAATAGQVRTTIEVNDTGAGIPAERLALLFDPAAHLGNAAGDGGSGLELVICQRMARLMGGDLEVESVMGQGSTFRLWFEGPPAPAEAAVATPTPTARGTVPLRILIVEDNPVLSFLLQQQLHHLGQDSVATPGGREALVELGRQPFDVVFADLHMPLMDGFELTRQLRALPLPRQPYVVAITADAAPRQRARCLAEGFDDFVTKPLSKNGLTALLAHISEATGGGGESPAVDRTALVALRANLGSSELLAELITAFIRDAHELLALFTSNDATLARRAAHSLKSTALTMGARGLSSIAADAEKGQPANAQDRARTELTRVETALRAVRL